MSAEGALRVLVVDDQILIRAGLAALLRAAPGIDVVGEAADGEDAVALAGSLRPDVILMDIRMPGVDGVTATRRILVAAPQPAPRIIALTTFDLDEYVYGVLRAGASGFLLKDTPPERLLAAVRAVADGDMIVAPTVMARLIAAYARRNDPPELGPPPELNGLTPRETDVLRLVGTGRSNVEIGRALVISEATVKTHLNRVMSKLGLTSRAQAVVLAYESGLVIPGR